MRVQEFPVEEEYRKHEEISRRDVARLREWAAAQPHIPEKYITDLDLLLVYHCSDFSSEVSKQLLDTQYTLRTHLTGLFEDRQYDSKIELALKTVLMATLPTRSQEGYACFYVHFLDPTPKHFVTADVTKTAVMVLDLWQYEEGSWPGLVVIIDLHGLGIGHMTRFELNSLQQFFCYVQEGIPLKLQSIHFINAPSYMDKLMTLLKPLMNKKVQELLQVHQVGSETVYNYYPKAGLPKEAGGSYKSFTECRDDIISKIVDNPDFFAQEKCKRVTESQRPGKPKTFSDFFGGIEGSFKKLDID